MCNKQRVRGKESVFPLKAAREAAIDRTIFNATMLHKNRGMANETIFLCNMLHNGGVTLNDFSELKLRNIDLPGFGVVSLYTTKTNKHNSDNTS